MLTGNSIILVIDSAENRSLLRKDLSQLGYSFITEASDLDEGMVKLEAASNSGSPVTVVMWAWTAAKNQRTCDMSKFRASKYLKSTPVIMLVNENELSQALVSASPYINGYLAKPHTLEVLKNCLPMALKNIS